jgi:hypothetical protein
MATASHTAARLANAMEAIARDSAANRADIALIKRHLGIKDPADGTPSPEVDPDTLKASLGPARKLGEALVKKGA